ncbi:MAG TPA: hypothetical protein PKB10_08200, partial [Tepidisphaeraceae bacterium]|nr:hypothetical protein [Tepidisphaeraceae bacterium]
MSRANADFRARADAFLDYVIDHADNPAATRWGDYRCFDGYTLAHFARRREIAGGWALFRDTLDMIDRNFAAEDADPNDKWHLADFAFHALFRTCLLHRDAGLEQDDADARTFARFEAQTRAFRWHFGDLTENHNLLHSAGRYLATDRIGAIRFRDGRDDRAHHAQAREELLRWFDKWLRRGSSEWGADIYYNINLLALLNLYDFSPEQDMREGARTLLDHFLLDEAIDSFAGAMVGSARRSYSCYRLDARANPSSPLHHLYFGHGAFNLHFIGAVILACTSAYRVPDPIVAIAQSPARPFEVRSHHVEGLFRNGPFPRRESDPPYSPLLGRHTWRADFGMISTMDSAGGRARYTEQVFQATLGPRALVFVNHPSAGISSDGVARPNDLQPHYETLAPFDPARPVERLWVLGNAPPGEEGDRRPGFWQGNQDGPRSYGAGRFAIVIYRLGEDAQVPYVHAYFPEFAFEETAQPDHWCVGRLGHAFIALWASVPGRFATQGIWRDIELRFDGPTVGFVCMIGTADDDASLRAQLQAHRPAWDASRLQIDLPRPGHSSLQVAYDRDPVRPSPPARLDTPWGVLP